MMNQGVLQRSPVQEQQMMANWWNINNMRPPISAQPTPFLLPPSNLFPHYAPPPPPSPSPPTSWNNNQELPESWSQLLLGGLVGEEEKTGLGHIQAKNLENWEEGQLLHLQPSNGPATWSQMIPPSASSPKSCVTSLSSNMLDFSSNKADGRHPPPDRSAECNSTASGGVLKKARVHQPSSTQSTFKVQVRKEKLGDRITALHQLVSPFGKTDTASVLLEAIGYIRFLQSQIEALSLPYLASGSENMRQQQQSLQGERNCLFPDDPGQLLNDNCMKRKGSSDEQDSLEGPKKDLRSRGLCLVPISCTLQVGSDNGADYWAPALGGGFR